jgi:hypothetical protein
VVELRVSVEIVLIASEISVTQRLRNAGPSSVDGHDVLTVAVVISSQTEPGRTAWRREAEAPERANGASAK